MKKTLIIVVLIVTMWSLLAAEDLSLERAVALAQNNNPELKAAEVEMNSAKKSLQSSYLGLIPSATLNYNKFFMNPGSQTGLDETSTTQISASQPIFNGGKIFLSTKIAANAYEIKQETYHSKFLEINSETETKFYSVQSNREMVKVLEKTLEQSVTNLEIAQAKYNAGLLSNAELLQMQSEKLSKELDLINMQNAYELSKLSLADYIGLFENFEVEEFSIAGFEELLLMISNIKGSKQREIEERLIEQGEMSNPTLLISELGINSAEQAKLMTAGNLLPSLNLSYNYTWQNSNMYEDYEGSSTLGIVASLPIFPIADNALDYQSASYDLKSSEHNFESAQNAIVLAIRSSFLNLLTSAKAVESAKLGSEYAWETWYQMRERFEQGMVSSNDLLSIEVLVISSDNNYITARQRLLESISQLTMLLGMQNNEQLINLINQEG